MFYRQATQHTFICFRFVCLFDYNQRQHTKKINRCKYARTTPPPTVTIPPSRKQQQTQQQQQQQHNQTKIREGELKSPLKSPPWAKPLPSNVCFSFVVKPGTSFALTTTSLKRDLSNYKKIKTQRLKRTLFNQD